MISRIAIAAASLALPTAVGAATLTLEADTYIRGGIQANSVNGNAGQLVAADNASDNSNFKIYLRYAVDPMVGTISDAELTFTIEFAYPFASPTLFAYQVYGMGDSLGDDWIESGAGGITYNTAPGHNPSAYQDMAGSVLLGSFSYVPQEKVEGDLLTFRASALDDFLNTGVGSDGLATLIVLAAPDQCCHDSWASMENVDFAGPSLTYVPAIDPPPPAIPLPAAGWALLLGLGSLVALGRRRG